MTKDEDSKLKAQTFVLKVSIHCEGCKKKVKKVLQSIEGVYTTTIDAPEQKVTVTGNVASADVLVRRLLKAGKPAEVWPQPQKNSDAAKQQQPQKDKKEKGPQPGKQQEQEKEKTPPKDGDGGETSEVKDNSGEKKGKKGGGKKGGGEASKKGEDAEDSGGAAAEGSKGAGGGNQEGCGAAAEGVSGGKKKKGGKGDGGGGGSGGEGTSVEPSYSAVGHMGAPGYGYMPVGAGGGGYMPTGAAAYVANWGPHTQGMGVVSHPPIQYVQYVPQYPSVYTQQTASSSEETASYMFNDENTSSCSVM